ncbi:Na+-driven multidrug efflux pump [Leptospira ryugenii]|uniref:Multidrug-efflux transporter n=1 Tax=Leptospira ryugenii TaxID=1917863 RepID=A0A2P2E2V5_9LEPT|nr:MATE family efflux transporter [Leptospira ryugenii]GBF51189.1 Na+-driven multidrug efflux pump [Leptospira ryugenii]
MAIPVFFGMISYTAIMISDTAMVGKLGEIPLAATGFGGMVYFAVFAFLMGGSMAVQIIVARRFGEKNEAGVGNTLVNAIYVSFLLGSILSIFGFYAAPTIMNALGDDPAVIEMSGEFLAYRFLGTLLFFLGFAIRGFFDGIGVVKAGMLSSISAALSNIFMNWILIFGNLGFPAMGVKGAAIASSLSSIPALLIMFFFFFREDILVFFKHKVWGPDFILIKELLVVGFAPAIEGAMTNLSFAGFYKIAGLISTTTLAASSVVISCMSLSFMPGVAFGVAATTILGQAMGQGKIRLAYEGTMRSATFSALVMGSMGIVFIVFGKPLLGFFTDVRAVISEAYPALVIVSFIQVGDAYHMVVGSALRSAGLMYWVMFAYIVISFLVMLPLAYLFGIVLKGGSIGIWIAFFIWILALALSFIRKFRKKEWINIRL